MHRAEPSVRVLFVLLPCLMTGCGLFERAATDTMTARVPWLHEADPDNVGPISVTSETPVRRIARVNAVLATRPEPPEDRRSLVWDQVAESGLMSPADRSRINSRGFRVGVAGATLPWALAGMVRSAQSAQVSESEFSGPTADLSGFPGQSSRLPLSLPEGAEGLIQVRPEVPAAVIPENQVSQFPAERRLEKVRCLLRVRPVEFGEHWVRFRILPELHHGAAASRVTLTAGVTGMPVRQNIVPLYDHQFEVKLHEGESVVLGCRDDSDWSVGRMFFQPREVTGRQESYVVLQLSDIESIQGERQADGIPRKY